MRLAAGTGAAALPMGSSRRFFKYIMFTVEFTQVKEGEALIFINSCEWFRNVRNRQEKWFEMMAKMVEFKRSGKYLKIMKFLNYTANSVFYIKTEFFSSQKLCFSHTKCHSSLSTA